MVRRSSTASFEHLRRLGFGRLLLMARRDFVARLNGKLRASGEVVLQSMLIAPYLDSTGTRSVEIARRMGVSKQAIGRMVRDLEAAGLVVQRPDPDDGRATRVVFTPEGLRYMRRMHRFVEDIERDYRALLGPESFTVTRESLRTIAYGSHAPERRRTEGEDAA
jgi:DNA-binding MarR family transcriptional regulator